MADVVKIIFEGQPTDAEQLLYTTDGPCVETLKVENGDNVAVTYRTLALFRMKDKKGPDGKPIYMCSMKIDIAHAVHVSAGEPMKDGAA